LGHYSEAVVYLPDSYLPNDATRRIAERTPSRSEAGLPEKGFVFCSFNNSYKFTPELFDTWMRLLSRVEDSVLWLPEVNGAAVRNLRREAAARGSTRRDWCLLRSSLPRRITLRDCGWRICFGHASLQRAHHGG